MHDPSGDREAEALARGCQLLLGGSCTLSPAGSKGKDSAVSTLVVLPYWVKLIAIVAAEMLPVVLKAIL